jgi:hypothetical protein
MVAITLLVASIAAIGAAPFSYQHQQAASDRQGPRITPANIVDGEVKNQDLAPNAVTSDKIKDGEVKEQGLDPSIQLGGGGSSPGFSLQVTERTNTVHKTNDATEGYFTATVQCNSDEVVTGGGYGAFDPKDHQKLLISPTEFKKQDNGWTATWFVPGILADLEVHAECLKVVNNGGTSTG